MAKGHAGWKSFWFMFEEARAIRLLVGSPVDITWVPMISNDVSLPQGFRGPILSLHELFKALSIHWVVSHPCISFCPPSYSKNNLRHPYLLQTMLQLECDDFTCFCLL